MDMTPKTRDLATTLAGGGAGLTLMLTVRWEQVPMGELAKIGVALILIAVGYFMYRNSDPPAPPPGAHIGEVS